MDPESQAAKALLRGEQARREGDLARAKQAFSEAVDIFRRDNSLSDLAHALTRRAQIARDIAAFDEALDDQFEAVAIYRSLSRLDRLAHSLRHLADILDASGRHQEAEPHYLEMLEVYRGLDTTPPLDLANAIRSVASHAEFMGRRDEARALWLEARERYSALDEQFRELTGTAENPGVKEAERRLAFLGR